MKKIGKLLIKHWILSGLGLLCLGLSLLFVWLGIYIINKPKPAQYVINLQSFEGRVLSEPVEIPSWMQTFQIISSFDDALKWDYNAVLQYSQTENAKGPNIIKVEIFKADCRFTGAVYHAEKEFPLWDPWLKAKAVYNVDKKELKFLPKISASFFLFSIAVECFLVFIVYSIIIEFKRKLKMINPHI
jgi:hypothetical protein